MPCSHPLFASTRGLEPLFSCHLWLNLDNSLPWYYTLWILSDQTVLDLHGKLGVLGSITCCIRSYQVGIGVCLGKTTNGPQLQPRRMPSLTFKHLLIISFTNHRFDSSHHPLASYACLKLSHRRRSSPGRSNNDILRPIEVLACVKLTSLWPFKILNMHTKRCAWKLWDGG